MWTNLLRLCSSGMAPVRYSEGESIDFVGPGVVILGREHQDGTCTLTTTVFARRNAGNVDKSLLQVQWAAGRGPGHIVFVLPVDKLYEASRIQFEFDALCKPDRDELSTDEAE